MLKLLTKDLAIWKQIKFLVGRFLASGRTIWTQVDISIFLARLVSSFLSTGGRPKRQLTMIFFEKLTKIIL